MRFSGTLYMVMHHNLLFYETVEYIGESAVTVLLQLLFDSESNKLVSDSEIRYPSHVDDIASICVKLLELKQINADVKGPYFFRFCFLSEVSN